MVARIATIEISVTHTEGEALLLESQWVKRLQPRYNISLRDDKSFPYIQVTTDQPFPAWRFIAACGKSRALLRALPQRGRGARMPELLQKIFPVRQCEDSVFKNRSRPCLQYQIERCSGPCVA